MGSSRGSHRQRKERCQKKRSVPTDSGHFFVSRLAGLPQPKLLPDQPAEAVFDFDVTWNRCAAAIEWIQEDVMPTTRPQQFTSLTRQRTKQFPPLHGMKAISRDLWPATTGSSSIMRR